MTMSNRERFHETMRYGRPDRLPYFEEGIRDEVVLMASGGIRTAYDIAKAVALGADGCVLGTSELVALGCTRAVIRLFRHCKAPSARTVHRGATLVEVLTTP